MGIIKKTATLGNHFSMGILERYQRMRNSFYEGASLTYLKNISSVKHELITRHPIYMTLRLLSQKIYWEQNTSILINKQLYRDMVERQLTQVMGTLQREYRTLYPEFKRLKEQINHLTTAQEYREMQLMLSLQMKRLRGESRDALSVEERIFLQRMEGASSKEYTREQIPILWKKYQDTMTDSKSADKVYSAEEKLVLFLNTFQNGSQEERIELRKFLTDRKEIFTDAQGRLEDAAQLLQKNPGRLVDILESWQGQKNRQQEPQNRLQSDNIEERLPVIWKQYQESIRISQNTNQRLDREERLFLFLNTFQNTNQEERIEFRKFLSLGNDFFMDGDSGSERELTVLLQQNPGRLLEILERWQEKRKELQLTIQERGDSANMQITQKKMADSAEVQTVKPDQVTEREESRISNFKSLNNLITSYVQEFEEYERNKQTYREGIDGQNEMVLMKRETLEYQRELIHHLSENSTREEIQQFLAYLKEKKVSPEILEYIEKQNTQNRLTDIEKQNNQNRLTDIEKQNNQNRLTDIEKQNIQNRLTDIEKQNIQNRLTDIEKQNIQSHLNDAEKQSIRDQLTDVQVQKMQNQLTDVQVQKTQNQLTDVQIQLLHEAIVGGYMTFKQEEKYTAREAVEEALFRAYAFFSSKKWEEVMENKGSVQWYLPRGTGGETTGCTSLETSHSLFHERERIRSVILTYVNSRKGNEAMLQEIIEHSFRENREKLSQKQMILQATDAQLKVMLEQILERSPLEDREYLLGVTEEQRLQQGGVLEKLFREKRLMITGELQTLSTSQQEILERPYRFIFRKRQLLDVVRHGSLQQVTQLFSYMKNNRLLEREQITTQYPGGIRSVLLHRVLRLTAAQAEAVAEQVIGDAEENIRLQHTLQQTESIIRRESSMVYKSREVQEQESHQVEELVKQHMVVEKEETRRLQKKQELSMRLLSEQSEELEQLKATIKEQSAQVEELKKQHPVEMNHNQLYREMMKRMENQLHLERQRRGLD